MASWNVCMRAPANSGLNLQCVVVDANEMVVAGDAKILLDKVHVLIDGEPIGRGAVLRRRARGAAMRDRLFPCLTAKSDRSERNENC